MEVLDRYILRRHPVHEERPVRATAFLEPPDGSSLAAGAEERPGLRLLEGRFEVNEFAMTLPKERPAALAFITEVIEQAKASRLVQQAAERSGLRGVQVPPLAAGQPAPAAPAMPAPAQVPRR